MKLIIIFMVMLVCQLGDCVIYRLNDTEYLRMPPMYHLDDYDSCLHEVNGTYCYVDIDLVSDTPSDLLQIIQEYSEHISKHFNHTQLHRGICLTKTCKHFLVNNIVDPRLALEGCLNQSLWRDYQLKSRLANKIFCNKLDDDMNINVGDICAAILFGCVGLLNIVGTLYDIYVVKGNKGHKLLLSFSLKRNFKTLIAHDNNDPLRERLKGFNGIRVLSIVLVILGHSPLPYVINTANPHDVEKAYDNIALHLYFNGTLIVQTFFIMSGCFIAYISRENTKNNKLKWTLVPGIILKRWLRLTPAYAVVLIFTMTWMRFIATGPLWEIAVGAEVTDCQRDGWWNMIYINNYIDNSQCMAQTWYLAASMQLFILGVCVCNLTNTSKSRNIILSALFFAGCVIPALHTYLQDLDALVLVTPETSRNFFVKDPTFNHSYKRGHTNIPSMVLGLALGNLIYDGLRDKKTINKYKTCGFLYYLTFPMIVGLILSGMVYYGDRPRPSIYLRTAVAGIIRPAFACLMTILLFGMVFKFENVYRKILEWNIWRPLARVSYSAFLIHVTIIRIFAGMNSTLTQMRFSLLLKEACGIFFITLLLAYPFWLFVEAPLNQAFAIILRLSKEDKGTSETHKLDREGKENCSRIEKLLTVVEENLLK